MNGFKKKATKKAEQLAT